MRFVETDGGRQFSKRPSQRNDCTVVAVVMATGMSYDEVYDHLTLLGRESNKGFIFPTGGTRVLSGPIGNWWLHYWPPDWEDHETLGEFVKANPRGTWIINTPEHVFTVKGGIIFDMFPHGPNETVLGVWAPLRIPAVPIKKKR